MKGTERYSSTNSDERVPLIASRYFDSEIGFVELPTNSWISTASIIVCSMAGVGVLGIPQALMSSGWSGAILLVFCCIANIYAGIILGKTMLRMPGRVKDYSEIGEEAFGTIGRRLAQFSIYVTLVGVGIIFLVLLGILMNGILPRVSHGFWTLAIGIVVLSPIAMSLRSYGEIKVISWFGFGATAIVVIVSIVMSILFFTSDNYHSQNMNYGFNHVFFYPEKFSVAFNVFTFAFGATAIFPNIFVKMLHKEEWPKAVVGGYCTSLLLYAPIAVIGYYVYGSYLANFSTILEAIQFFDPKTSFILKICSAIMIAHIVTAFPIVINPVFLALEREIIEKRGTSTFWKRFLVRGSVMSVLIVAGLFFPYFLDIMSLISCISVSLSGYILPCLFYWKICKPRVYEKVWLIFIIIFGLVGSVVGIYLSVATLIEDVKKNPNPFTGLFRFD